MNVYSVIYDTQYSGQELSGVFDSRKAAIAYIRSVYEEDEDLSGEFCIVESTLGVPTSDFWKCEWWSNISDAEKQQS